MNPLDLVKKMNEDAGRVKCARCSNGNWEAFHRTGECPLDFLPPDAKMSLTPTQVRQMIGEYVYGTDDEIAAEVEAMSDEEIHAELAVFLKTANDGECAALPKAKENNES